MGLYRLKAGGFTQGRGDDAENPFRTFYSSDPNNNVVESDLDLAADDPEKFEVYKGPRPKYLGGAGVRRSGTDDPGSVSVSGSGPAPGPTTAQAVADAVAMSGSLTADDMEKRAEELTRQAEILKKSAQQSRKAQQEGEKQAETSGGPPEGQKAAKQAAEGKASPPKAGADFDNMTKDELVAFAEENEIEVKKSGKVDDIRAAVKKGAK